MIFRRKKPGESGTAVDAAPPGDAQPSPSFTKAVERAFRREHPEILDLGPFCGETVVQLAARGARVQVDRFIPPTPTPVAKPGEPPIEPPPLALEQPEGRFDLVLAWEQVDFVPPDRLAEFGAELCRVTKAGGWVLFFSSARPRADNDVPARYRLRPNGSLVREPLEEPPRRRWIHPNREIDRAMKGLALQGIHLQRNQMREFLLMRREGS